MTAEKKSNTKRFRLFIMHGIYWLAVNQSAGGAEEYIDCTSADG